MRKKKRNEFGDILDNIRGVYFQSVDRMARRIGYSARHLTRMETGEYKINRLVVDRIIEKYHLDKEVENKLKSFIEE